MEVRNMVPSTVLLILRKENQVLLMKRANTGYEDGNYGFPGGHIEKGEHIFSAIIREAKEELGITLKKEDLTIFKVLQRKTADNFYIDFLITCDKWEGTLVNQESEKCDEIVWKDMHALPENVIPFMKNIFKNNSIFCSFGWEDFND